MLMRRGGVVAHAKRNRSLFILDLVKPGRAMHVTTSSPPRIMAVGRGRPTHIVSKNKRIRIWHRRLGHGSNVRVIRASKLVDAIDIGATPITIPKKYLSTPTCQISKNSQTSPTAHLQLARTPPAIEDFLP